MRANEKLLPKRALMYWMGQERCQTCGIDDPEVLSIDHVLRNGPEHRRQLGIPGRGPESVRLYREVLRQGMDPRFPLQVLCFNCHFKKDHHRRWYRSSGLPDD